VAGVVGLIHVKSAVLLHFLVFLFSYFHLFIFHPIIFVCFMFAYFQECRAHEQYAFRQVDVS
jgi:hypothetical protein